MFEIFNKNAFQNVEGLRNPKKFPPAAGYQGIQVKNPPLLVPNLKQGRILKKTSAEGRKFFGVKCSETLKNEGFGPAAGGKFLGSRIFF